ncbi:hypothetical protein sphantq_01993 [Sphingobium sp. AntQ-1]|nr:hypothetical protein sphantq_01993 [Sphingobium sp. AntQ-1]
MFSSPSFRVPFIRRAINGSIQQESGFSHPSIRTRAWTAIAISLPCTPVFTDSRLHFASTGVWIESADIPSSETTSALTPPSSCWSGKRHSTSNVGLKDNLLRPFEGCSNQMASGCSLSGTLKDAAPTTACSEWMTEILSVEYVSEAPFSVAERAISSDEASSKSCSCKISETESGPASASVSANTGRTAIAAAISFSCSALSRCLSSAMEPDYPLNSNLDT